VLCVQKGSGRVLTCVKIRDWAIGVVDNLYIITISFLDKANPLGVDIDWVDTVYLTAFVGGKIESDRFRNECLVLRRVSVTNRWCSNGGYIVYINFHGRITTVARNRDRARRHC
jgi:hypothetical protein